MNTISEYTRIIALYIQYLIRTTFFLRLGFLAATTLLLTACLYCWGPGYDAVTTRLTEAYGERPEKLQTLLTPARFRLLRLLLTALALAAPVLTGYAWNRGPRVTVGAGKLRQHGRQLAGAVGTFWSDIPRAEKVAVVALWAAFWLAQGYVAFRLPFHVDERFTYLYFVSRGWLVSMAYYPGPNNHILFTLLCNAVDIFLNDPFQVMKGAALLAGAMLPPVFWAVVRWQSGPAVAWLATAALCSTDKVFYYATQGRGYSLLTVWVVLAAYSTTQIVRPGAVRRLPYVLLGISSVLGFYTVPVFLFPGAGLALYLMVTLGSRSEYRKLKHAVLTGVWAAAAVGFLYLPVILANGWAALSANAWVTSLSWSRFRAVFAAYLLDVAGGLWFGDWLYYGYLTGGMLALALGVLLTKGGTARARQWAGMWLAQAVVVAGLPALQGVLPPARIFGYLAVFSCPLLAWWLVRAMSSIPASDRVRLAVVAATGLLVFASTVARFEQLARSSALGLYGSLDQVAALLYQQGAQSVFTENYEYNLCIRFRFGTAAKPIRADTGLPRPGFPYQYVVVPRGRSFPAALPSNQYRPLYHDAEAIVFRLQPSPGGYDHP